MNSKLEYPINVLEEALNYFEGEPLATVFPNGLTDEQVNGIYFVLNRLQARYRDLLQRHYKSGESFVKIAASNSITKARVYQLLHMAFSDMLSKTNYKFIRDGVGVAFINGTNTIVIKDTGVHHRISNALGRAGIFTIGDLICFFEEHTMKEFMAIRCMGLKNYDELRNALLIYDIDLNDYQEAISDERA